MYYEPKLSVHSKLKKKDEVVHLDPVEAYKAGYLDASIAMLNAETSFVTTLRVTGWKDEDILRALLTALRSYTNGKGLEDTTYDVMRVYSGPERINNGKPSTPSKL